MMPRGLIVFAGVLVLGSMAVWAIPPLRSGSYWAAVVVLSVLLSVLLSLLLSLLPSLLRSLLRSLLLVARL